MTALLEVVLVGIGLFYLVVLLVIGVVAAVRDWLSERADLRKAIECVQREMAERRGTPSPSTTVQSAPVRHDHPAQGGRHAA